MPVRSPETVSAHMWLPIHHEHRHAAHFGRPALREPSGPAAFVGYGYPSCSNYSLESHESATVYSELPWTTAACTVEQAQSLASHGGVLPRLQTTFSASSDNVSQASPIASSWTDSPGVATPSPTIFGGRASPAVFAPVSDLFGSEYTNPMFYPDYYTSQTISPYELGVVPQPAILQFDASASCSANVSVPQTPTPSIVTPQPRHPADRVQQLLHRYLTAPPSPERTYEVFREDAFNSYQAHLASQHAQAEVFVATGSEPDPSSLYLEHQEKPPVGLGISIPSRSITPTVPRKPSMMACLFCRGRKIACNAPPLGTPDRTCAQCAKRKQPCVFPTVCRRGQKRSAATPLDELSAPDAPRQARPEGHLSNDRSLVPARKRARQ